MWKPMVYCCLPKLAPMKPIIIILFTLSSSLFLSLPFKVEPAHSHNYAQITVMGLVYCDICSNNSFSTHSYFIPGAQVRIDCRFKAVSPRTREQITVSVNRTTNRHGMYKLDIPSVDGVSCAEAAMGSSCQASLLRSSSSSCNVPGYGSTTDEIEFKAKRPNLCIYSLNALSFKPSKRDLALCG